jgi:hypothetical protein
MNKEELIKIFIDGPLKEYLTGDISYGRMIELINEKCGTNFKYSNLYPSYLFNATLKYPDVAESYFANAYANVDYQGRMEHTPTCEWHSDWHKCNCGAFDKDNK